MNLVVIYGPPAVGKFTVAKELAKLTGYKILPNFLGGDFVGAILERDSSVFKTLRERLRRILIREAIKQRVRGVIMTYCARGKKERHLKTYFPIIRKSQGVVCLVHLVCDRREILKRVENPNRMKNGYRTLVTKRKLKQRLSKYDFFSQVPFGKTYQIDNTRLPAKKVAQMIQEHYGL